MIAVYGLGATELLIILIIVLFFPAAIIVFALLKVFKGRNRDRIGVIESRLESLEGQLDRQSEPSASKGRDSISEDGGQKLTGSKMTYDEYIEHCTAILKIFPYGGGDRPDYLLLMPLRHLYEVALVGPKECLDYWWSLPLEDRLKREVLRELERQKQ
jgi:hypothetical protein